jgi:hypothetical protein
MALTGKSLAAEAFERLPIDLETIRFCQANVRP